MFELTQQVKSRIDEVHVWPASEKAPSFDARGETNRDLALIDRLLEAYGRKYPDEIGKWRDRMRKGTEDGSRVTIRYTPIEG